MSARLEKLGWADGHPGHMSPSEKRTALGTALTIAPMFIPGVGGVASRVAAGALSGGIMGAGQSMITGENVWDGARDGALFGGAFGGAGKILSGIGSGAGKLLSKFRPNSAPGGFFSNLAQRFPRLTGAAQVTAGVGLPAGFGALSDPENPLRGAALGVGAGFAGGAAGGAAQRLMRPLAQRFPRATRSMATGLGTFATGMAQGGEDRFSAPPAQPDVGPYTSWLNEQAAQYSNLPPIRDAAPVAPRPQMAAPNNIAIANRARQIARNTPGFRRPVGRGPFTNEAAANRFIARNPMFSNQARQMFRAPGGGNS